VRKRPLAVTIFGWLYVVVGVAGVVAHSRELLAQPRQSDALWAVGTALAAILAGVYVLPGRNWARWLAVAWMGFHVVISIFHTPVELIVHLIFLAATVWALFGRPAAGYFHPRDL
jgi:hypothetical protein